MYCLDCLRTSNGETKRLRLNLLRNKKNCMKVYLLLRNINHWHPLIIIWLSLLCYCPLLVHSKCRDELSYHETSDWENYHQYNSLTNRISSSSIYYTTLLRGLRLHLNNFSSRSCKNNLFCWRFSTTFDVEKLAFNRQ